MIDIKSISMVKASAWIAHQEYVKEMQMKKLYKKDYEDMLADFNERIKFHKQRLGEK